MQYAAFDPDFQENQKALKAGIEEIGDRFVTKNDAPPFFGYLVSKLDEKRRPGITMFYGNDGHLMILRIFSQPEYPRIAYMYCVENNLRYGGKEFESGELMSVSIRVSEKEDFYFQPDGKFSGHNTF